MSNFLGSKPMPFPPGSSGNGMVDGYLRDWEREQGEEPDMEPFEAIPDPAIQEGVNSIYEILIDTQPLMEAILSMPIDAIQRFKGRIYEALEEWKEEWVA